MSKFLQEISESRGTIRTRELSVPRGYYGINKELNSGSIIRIKNGVYILLRIRKHLTPGEVFQERSMNVTDESRGDVGDE